MRINPPKALPDEQPTCYAMRVMDWYKSWQKPNPQLGQFFTPSSIATFMVNDLSTSDSTVRVLDAGAGMGILACAVCEKLSSNIDLVVYEIDPQLISCLEAVLSHTALWMSYQGRQLIYSIHNDDFVLSNAYALELSIDQERLFDIVISNPPYLKITKSDRRAVVTNRIIHGQPNLYMLFMGIAAALLRIKGQFIFITPRSYTSGSYFRLFRHYFLSFMCIKAVHLFESRKNLFDTVLQENMIIWAERSPQTERIQISISTSLTDLAYSSRNDFVFEELLGEDLILHLPTTSRAFDIMRVFRSWSGRLNQYDIEISTGRVVPFRASDWIKINGAIMEGDVPLFWMHNIRLMQWQWPLDKKPQYLSPLNANHLIVPNTNYVILHRFSPKEGRRVTAAPYLGELDIEWVGIENHLNYLYRKVGDLSLLETYGLAVFLNSQWVDVYLQQTSGNTQIGATDLRNMPFPPLESIVEMGRLYMNGNRDIEHIMMEVLTIYA